MGIMMSRRRIKRKKCAKKEIVTEENKGHSVDETKKDVVTYYKGNKEINISNQKKNR